MIINDFDAFLKKNFGPKALEDENVAKLRTFVIPIVELAFRLNNLFGGKRLPGHICQIFHTYKKGGDLVSLRQCLSLLNMAAHGQEAFGVELADAVASLQAVEAQIIAKYQEKLYTLKTEEIKKIINSFASLSV